MWGMERERREEELTEPSLLGPLLTKS